MTLLTGTITKITDRDSDFRFEYLDDKGGRGEFVIGKKEALRRDFIASAEGRPLKLDVDARGIVRTAIIDSTVVLRR